MNESSRILNLPYWNPSGFEGLNHCSTDFVTAAVTVDIFHYQCCYHTESCVAKAQQRASKNISFHSHFYYWTIHWNFLIMWFFLHNKCSSFFVYSFFQLFSSTPKMGKRTITHNCKTPETLVQFLVLLLRQRATYWMKTIENIQLARWMFHDINLENDWKTKSKAGTWNTRKSTRISTTIDYKHCLFFVWKQQQSTFNHIFREYFKLSQFSVIRHLTFLIGKVMN